MGKKWISNVNTQEWQQMREDEKEAYFYEVLGITKQQLIQEVVMFEASEPRQESPNTLFVSSDTLFKMPMGVTVKWLQFPASNNGKKVRLRVIPVKEKDGFFAVSLQDPWKWGNLFYS